MDVFRFALSRFGFCRSGIFRFTLSRFEFVQNVSFPVSSLPLCFLSMCIHPILARNDCFRWHGYVGPLCAVKPYTDIYKGGRWTPKSEMSKVHAPYGCAIGFKGNEVMVAALFEEHSLSKTSCHLIDNWTVCFCEEDSMCNLRVSHFAKMAGFGNITGEPYHTDDCLTKTHFWLITTAVVALFILLVVFRFTCWYCCFRCGFRKGCKASSQATTTPLTSVSLDD